MHTESPASRAGALAATGLSPRRLSRAMQFLEANLGEAIRLTDVAEAACLSRAHFARSFRLTTGRSVMALLTELRIERAKQRLSDEPAALADLASSLGFADQSHFCRVFRRRTGLTPGRYARHPELRPRA